MRKLLKINGACVLCALCYVSSIDEETVLRICTSYGFKEGSGMEDREWQNAARHLEVDYRGVALQPMLLKQFIKNNPEGLFLLGTCDHLFVLDNGIVIDPRNPKAPGLRRMIRQAWKVLKD